MCRTGSSTSRTVDRPCLCFFGFGRSILFTLPLVGWVIRSILETDHVLEISHSPWSASMAPDFKTSDQKPRRGIEVGTPNALTKITAIALAEVALTPENGSSGHVHLYTDA